MKSKAQKTADFEKGNAESAAEFIELIALCLEEGYSPTRCPEGCPVEPDGICPHGFKSAALEYGLI